MIPVLPPLVNFRKTLLPIKISMRWFLLDQPQLQAVVSLVSLSVGPAYGRKTALL
jgi:hypothetical protein